MRSEALVRVTAPLYLPCSAYPNRTMRLIELLHQCGVPMIIFSDSDLFPL